MRRKETLQAQWASRILQHRKLSKAEEIDKLLYMIL
jgi:hypothetical protein